MKNGYDVHFNLSGYCRITAETPEEAQQITEEIIETRLSEVEEIVRTAIGVEVQEVVPAPID